MLCSDRTDPDEVDPLGKLRQFEKYVDLVVVYCFSSVYSVEVSVCSDSMEEPSI